ncbi:hypothetical protein M0R72_07545 [Candidatus Pacearchaeota archaeon]|jgi:hypothetical protein|nr:hypothetical protein [Candidatus Pacearchaeota archaeon]
MSRFVITLGPKPKDMSIADHRANLELLRSLVPHNRFATKKQADCIMKEAQVHDCFPKAYVAEQIDLRTC